MARLPILPTEQREGSITKGNALQNWRSILATARATPFGANQGNPISAATNDALASIPTPSDALGLLQMLHHLSNLPNQAEAIYNSPQIPGQVAQGIADHPLGALATMVAPTELGTTAASAVGSKMLAPVIGDAGEAYLRSVLHIPWTKTRLSPKGMDVLQKVVEDLRAYKGLPWSDVPKQTLTDIALHGTVHYGNEAREAAQRVLKRFPDLADEPVYYDWLDANPRTADKPRPPSFDLSRTLGKAFVGANRPFVVDDYRWYESQLPGVSSLDMVKGLFRPDKTRINDMGMHVGLPGSRIIENDGKSLGNTNYQNLLETLATRHAGNYGVRIEF